MSVRRLAVGALVALGLSISGWAADPVKKSTPSKDDLLERLVVEGGLDAQKALELRPQLEAELAMRSLLASRALAESLDKWPKVAASMELARQNALAQAYLDKMEQELAPTEAELLSDYHSAYPQKRLAKVKFALYASEQKAVAALDSLVKQSATIEEVAKRGDDQLVAQRQGNFGVVSLDAMPEQVAAAIAAEPTRKWPIEPVKTAYGYVLYELSGIETGRERSFEQAKQELEKRRKQLMMRVELAKIKEVAARKAR